MSSSCELYLHRIAVFVHFIELRLYALSLNRGFIHLTIHGAGIRIISGRKERENMLTLNRAKELNGTMVTEPHLIMHALSVSAAMGAMAEHFGEDKEHWQAVGYLHDYDYEKFPEEHLQHTEKELLAEGVDAADVRAIMAHGYGHCTDVEPVTAMEKSLFTVDELTGIIGACARMRPNGLSDLEIGSFMKKFKDKRFAAKCDRELIKSGCEMLSMDVKEVASICIEGMKPYAAELGLTGTASDGQ